MSNILQGIVIPKALQEYANKKALLDYDDNTYRFIATIRPPGGYKRVDPVKGKIKTARAYISAGLKDKAKDILRDVLEDHADSEHAKEAEELLKSLE